MTTVRKPQYIDYEAWFDERKGVISYELRPIWDGPILIPGRVRGDYEERITRALSWRVEKDLDLQERPKSHHRMMKLDALLGKEFQKYVDFRMSSVDQRSLWTFTCDLVQPKAVRLGGLLLGPFFKTMFYVGAFALLGEREQLERINRVRDCWKDGWFIHGVVNGQIRVVVAYAA